MMYRKKPVVIEAYQTDKELDIETLEGVMHASVGDYIITGVNGEQYPCKPDIFRKTYEPVSDDQEEQLENWLNLDQFVKLYDEIYPLTLTCDRYSGAYSDGNWIAWNVEADDVPAEQHMDDVTCMKLWWGENPPMVGRGRTPQEAILDLYLRLMNNRLAEPPGEE